MARVFRVFVTVMKKMIGAQTTAHVTTVVSSKARYTLKVVMSKDVQGVTSRGLVVIANHDEPKKLLGRSRKT